MIDIKNENGHYVVYVNGKFYGSYDTIVEAAKDVDAYAESVGGFGGVIAS